MFAQAAFCRPPPGQDFEVSRMQCSYQIECGVSRNAVFRFKDALGTSASKAKAQRANRASLLAIGQTLHAKENFKTEPCRKTTSSFD